MSLELTITRPGSLLSQELRRAITEEQLVAIRTVLDGGFVLPPLTGQECGEIAITAAEGGIGYWSVIDSYDWHRWARIEDTIGHGHPDNSAAPDDPSFVFYTIRYENPHDRDPLYLSTDITPELIRRGFVLALDKGREDLVRRVLGLAREDWMGEIDADGADVIIQCGVFGEVVFG